MLFGIGGSLLGSSGRRTRNPLEVVIDELADEGLCAEKWTLVGADCVKKLGCMTLDEGNHDGSDCRDIQGNASGMKKLEVFKDSSDKFWIQRLLGDGERKD